MTGVKPLHRLRSVRLVGWSVSGAAAHALFGAVTTIILARALGPEGLGAYGVFLAVAFLLNQVGDLGLGTAYVRLATPVFQSSGDARRLTWTFFQARFVAVAVLALGVVVAARLLDRPAPDDGPLSVLLPAAAAAVLMAVGSHYNEVLRARLAHRAAAAIRGTLGAVRALAFATLFSLGALNLGAAVAVALLVTATESVALAALGHRGATLWPPVTPRFERAWLTLSWWLFITSATSALLTQTDTLLLAWLGGEVETGLWVAASRLVGPIPLLVGAVWSVVLPISMALGDPAKLTRYLTLSWRTSWLALATCALATLVIAPVVTLCFGSSYADTIPAARWLLFAFGANVAAILYGGLIHRLGFERDLAAVSAVLLAINVVGDVALIPRFGATGCAVVTAIVLLTGAVWTVWRVERARPTLLAAVANGEPIPAPPDREAVTTHG
ncbi:MAG: oligosaccharide flippase family protein [Gemmatimonadota bacterium]|nr:MAG: oligosaccharide flippase family protein [Gemmatimonadota bacterium]